MQDRSNRGIDTWLSEADISKIATRRDCNTPARTGFVYLLMADKVISAKKRADFHEDIVPLWKTRLPFYGDIQLVIQQPRLPTNLNRPTTAWNSDNNGWPIMGHCRRKFSTPLHGGEKTGEAGRKRGFTTIGDDAHLQTDFPIWVNDQYRSIRSRREIYRGFEFHCMYIYIQRQWKPGKQNNTWMRHCCAISKK